jgi:hypothetical protein
MYSSRSTTKDSEHIAYVIAREDQSNNSRNINLAICVRQRLSPALFTFSVNTYLYAHHYHRAFSYDV